MGNWDSVSRVFVLGKSHPPRAFPLLEDSEFLMMLLSLIVILRSCIASLKVLNYDLEDHLEESLRLCSFYSDYTNGVGRLCAESLAMIDYSTDTPKFISQFSNVFLCELIHKLLKIWLSQRQFYSIKLLREYR